MWSQLFFKQKVIIEKPEGFAIVAEDGTKLMCKIKKSIFGLKQASKTGMIVLEYFFLNKNFQPSKSDYFPYVKGEETSLIHIRVSVDDNIVTGSDLEQIKILMKN